MTGVQTCALPICLDRDASKKALDAAGGSVKLAIVMSLLGVGREDAEKKLAEQGGVIRRVVKREPPPVMSK